MLAWRNRGRAALKRRVKHPEPEPALAPALEKLHRPPIFFAVASEENAPNFLPLPVFAFFLREYKRYSQIDRQR